MANERRSCEISRPLLVDLYELTMADAYRRTGMSSRPATFSLFVRNLPPNRGYLVAAGLDDALTWLEELRFEAEDLAIVERLGLFGPEFLDWLAGLRFTGSVRAVPEGTIVFGDEPILEVDAPIGEAQLAESFLLNQTTLQTMLATKAARCRHAAAGRSVIDFALRRCQGIDAAVKLARVAGIVGLDGTSNVAAADRYGLPASGTMAHSFVQAHSDEVEAFRAFATAFGERTVLLVDTYNTPRGIDRAIQVAGEMRARGTEIGGVRLDSGDLAELARLARRRLDEAGFAGMRIFASGGLDEYAIDELVTGGAPIDGFGVGTALGVSADAPSLDSAYKLVCYDGRPVRKTSEGKRTWPSGKQVWRADDWSEDVLGLADEAPPSGGHRPLLVEVMRHGRRTADGQATAADNNRRFEEQWAALPPPLRPLIDPASHPVRVSGALREVDRELDRIRAQEER